MTTPLPARAKPLRPGDPPRIGAYTVIGFLGKGGMGVVYLGRGPNGQLVAIKVVRAEFARVPEFRARFRREAHSAMRVPRFCTAEVVAADPDAAEPYLVTEYIDGPTLDEAVRSGGPLKRAELDQLGVSMAAALTGIHAAGVVHRDLKPANVLLSRMGPRVIDFGIANAVDSVRLTAEGQTLGTPAYMAPEQMRGRAGPATDVFAWGGVMVFAATGRAPFGAGPLPALASRIMNAEPHLDGLDEPMRGIVAAALAKDESRRPTPGRLLELMGVAGTDPTAAVQTRLAGMGLPDPTLPPQATWGGNVPEPAPETVVDAAPGAVAAGPPAGAAAGAGSGGGVGARSGVGAGSEADSGGGAGAASGPGAAAAAGSGLGGAGGAGVAPGGDAGGGAVAGSGTDAGAVGGGGAGAGAAAGRRGDAGAGAGSGAGAADAGGAMAAFGPGPEPPAGAGPGVGARPEAGGPAEDQEVTLRFGPGVRTAGVPEQATRIWREGATSSPPGRPGARRGGPRRSRWARARAIVSGLVSLGIFAAVAVWLILRFLPGELLVNDVTVKAVPEAKTCGDVTLSGVVTTNGKPGRLTYRWKLSDRPRPEPPQEITVSRGTTSVRLSFVWQFSGRGRPADYAATLIVRGGDQQELRDTDSFTYSCPR